MLSPGAPPGRVVTAPVSLRDLPATVVDQLGLSAGSPFPGRSLAAHWTSTAGGPPPGTTPALSELARAGAIRPRTGAGLWHRGFQMSLVDPGRHYIRDGEGTEQIYDVVRDPFERTNLIDSPEGHQAVADLRRKLLELLTADPGSTAVERAILGPFRQGLQSLVGGGHPPPDNLSALRRRPDG